MIGRILKAVAKKRNSSVHGYRIRTSPNDVGSRTCLTCSSTFNSWGAGNRICPRCKNSDAYKVAREDDGVLGVAGFALYEIEKDKMPDE